MRRPRRIVGWQLREDEGMRVFRHAMTRASVDQILDEGRTTRLDTYWCAADKPEHCDVLPVYNSTKTPEGAECATCDCSIADLQAMQNDLLDRVWGRS